MALINGNFRGSIDGKNIWKYQYGLDYKVETLEERKKLVNNLLNIVKINNIEFSNDKFWQEVFDSGVCKSNLNTTDILWSETNICKFLEKVGTYLISEGGKNGEYENIKVYDIYSEFKRAIQQENTIRKYGDIVEYDLGDTEEGKGRPVVILKNQKNYKLAPDVKINKKDREKYKEIEDYYQYKQYLLNLKNDKDSRNKLAKKINIDTKSFKMKSNGDVYRFICKHLPLVEDDMHQVKTMKDKNIVWKKPLKDSGNNQIDWDFLDMLDPIHVKALLQISTDKTIIDDISLTRDMIIEEIELTEVQRNVLDLWKGDKTQKDIAKILNISQQSVSSQLDKIVNKFIDKYIEKYEDEYYYIYLVKGKYKKCSKCGEIKLIQRFDKKGKQGYQSQCKQCRRKKDQNHL